MNANSDVSPPIEKPHDLAAGFRPAARNSVLIVDDEAQFIELMAMQLEHEGFQVDSATDGAQGIKKIMESDYEIILCDLVMPKLAGDMFYRAVERVKPHLCRRFIFVTAYRDDPKSEAFIRQVDGPVLWKPFQFRFLLEAIEAVKRRNESDKP
jgi:DNA-binding response OmpR family regulator